MFGNADVAALASRLPDAEELREVCVVPHDRGLIDLHVLIHVVRALPGNCKCANLGASPRWPRSDPVFHDVVFDEWAHRPAIYSDVCEATADRPREREVRRDGS